MRQWLSVLVLTLATGCASPGVAPPPTSPDAARQVADAERAFDAYTAEHGFTAGFLAYAAPDGLLFRPDPVNARDYLRGREPSTDTALRWGPARVGVARSGDLAWDTGPWTYGGDQAHGWFFTVWQRQPDGRWQWVLDHGAGPTEHPTPVPSAQAVIVDRPAAGLASPQSDPWAEVQAMDAALNARLVTDGAQRAYANILAEDVWANTPDQGPVMDRPGVMTAFAARPRFTGFEPIGGGASAAGDLAYSYGHVRWIEDGADRRGHMLRIWRRDGRGPQGWRLVYDQFTPVALPSA